MPGLICAICGSPYLPHRHDYLWVCIGCMPNLQAQCYFEPRDGALAVDAEMATRLLAEQALEWQPTARQEGALARLRHGWRQQDDAS